MQNIEVKIEIVQGQPALSINGCPIFLSAPYLHKAPYESFAEAAPGVWMLHDHAFAVAPDGTIDFANVEQAMDVLLARDPEALAIVRSFPPTPAWWMICSQ